jgi:hypothetical protein
MPFAHCDLGVHAGYLLASLALVATACVLWLKGDGMGTARVASAIVGVAGVALLFFYGLRRLMIDKALRWFCGTRALSAHWLTDKVR